MFSLVIPIFNEEKLVDELVERTISSIETFTQEYEVIFVDDGSTDRSLEILLCRQKKNNNIKILSLSKNFGHQAAYTAGLEYSRGEVVAMMDGDLQDPPELMADMYRLVSKEDYDVVSGKRIGRKGNRGRVFYEILFHLILSLIHI